MRDLQFRVKRGLDIVLALLLAIGLSPLLAGIAIAIRLTSRGPVLISQWRDGRAGTPFRMLKFRTMYQGMGDPTGVTQTTNDDPRITRFGRWLRKTSADELPQLLNVLIGQMSLIGPRPHPIGMLAGGRPYDELVPYYAHRHTVRPGMSGWAQCNGLRGPTDDPEIARARIDHDLAYIQNFTLWLDLRIMVRTITHQVLRGTGS